MNQRSSTTYYDGWEEQRGAGILSIIRACGKPKDERTIISAKRVVGATATDTQIKESNPRRGNMAPHSSTAAKNSRGTCRPALQWLPRTQPKRALPNNKQSKRSSTKFRTMLFFSSMPLPPTCFPRLEPVHLQGRVLYCIISAAKRDV